MRRFFSVVLVVSAWAAAGCKETGDYLVDLERLDPRQGGTVFDQSVIVFDEGQLAHEALVGLAEVESMTFYEAMRSLSRAARFLGRARDNALLRADAAVLIGRLAVALPIPADREPFERRGDGVQALALEQIEKLDKARDPVAVGGLIRSLSAQDETIVQNALASLRQRTGEDFERDTEAWNAWWEEEKQDFEDEFVEASREPVAILGSIEFKNASQARELLGFLALWISDAEGTDLEPDLRRALMRIARQTVVFSLTEAIDDPDAQVRVDVVRAMSAVRDPRFGEPLLRQLQREREIPPAVHIVRALRDYPSRRTVRLLVEVAASEEERLSYSTNEVLIAMTGVEADGIDPVDWPAWWEEIGDKTWP